jgi:hypothetical protein
MNTMITSSVATNGVNLASMMPAVAGNIAAGESGGVTLKYSVPLGVLGFRVINTASTDDTCGNSHTYP